MSTNDRWMPLYVAEYLADTLPLTTLQHGAYLLLLMHYWRTGPLPNDEEELASIVKADAKSWKLIWPKVGRFFVENGDGMLHQKRADRELERCSDISSKRSSAGKAGANAKLNGSKPHGKPEANAQQTDQQTTHQKGTSATPFADPQVQLQLQKQKESIYNYLDLDPVLAPAREDVPSVAEISTAREQDREGLKAAGGGGLVVLALGKSLRRPAYAQGAWPNQTHQDAIGKALDASSRRKSATLTDEQLKVVREQARKNLQRRGRTAA
jgi:uncharacterized protein YdaU (DUF1376 family)